ncbi:MAG: UPF0104 family protein [Mesorhizobium sp.]|uniref:lysylphosphatidylglycerol synthase domain-containing protein n=1 Tax=unclassified Mesorhizobium TaxID=325217 RepID=UPI000BAEAE8B|nr:MULTISPECIES: lysylphosphatidylglycerol synthase domain-containing protein [unclassified Mesorhizobium]WIE90561.1 lysylphosphatidylglycerol synthase domain-containing protein [Mesorhizobium sp. WSM4875]PBB43813.1 hypothetical protein CK222_08625 [Mesorhizobium sp. WSM3866]RWG53117.1 MAG: UPF0104 family protein [Mesorhizobium sp.]RWH31661.1 MAG: UPF0104 family protein [Mesorhizobium sp.]RWH37133.1 MAG: UPF0104 family protein [Mesorhizobium sp.]
MKKAFSIIVTLALLAWLAADSRWKMVGDAFASITPGAFAAVTLALFVTYVLRALRVCDEFRDDVNGRFGACLRVILIHNAMINVVPFRGGETAFPLLLRQVFGISIVRAGASLLWFRLQDAFVVGVLACLVWPGLHPALRAAAIAALIAAAWYLPRWARAPHDWAGRGSIVSKLGKLRDIFTEATGRSRYGWWWTVANWTLKLAVQGWLLAMLLGTSFQTAFPGAVGAEAAAILPVQGVAGFGTYEAGAAAALLYSGIAMKDGLQAALALHLFILCSAVATGAIAWLFPSKSTLPETPATGPARK